MRILFIGDIYGRSGREALTKHLPVLREAYEPDVVIVNGENAANGRGITEKICKEIYELGADCITTGNHVWDQREIIPYIARDKTLLRPLNFPGDCPGSGVYRHQLSDGRAILIMNAMGRIYMDAMDDPFARLDQELKMITMGQHVQAVFVDFHGETTSEKMAAAHYLDGRISGLVGTHTHVPTADAHILSGGTAYLTDAGMTGDYDSVIGADKDVPIQRFVRKMSTSPMKPASGEGMLCGVFIETNDNTGLATHIEPVRRGKGLSETELPS